MINTIKHLAYVLGSSNQKLLYIIANLDQYYYSHRQPKKKYGEDQKDEKENIKYRNLCISRYPLKKIQKRIHNLLRQIKLPEYAFGSVKGKNNILNARRHISNKHFFSTDLKDFFPNINHRQVFRMFRQNNFSPTVSRILTQLTTYKGSLPQGPPSSPIISNLVFVETGKKLTYAIKDHNITFTSFLDDLSFSSKSDFKHLTQPLIQIIKADNFYINHKKITYKVSRPEITGAVIHGNQLWPIKKMQERAKENPYIAAYIKAMQANS
jgi:RNA-directed DNA polymerase